MKKSMFQKVICFILSVTTLFSVVAFTVAAEVGEYKPGNTAATLEEMKAVVGTTSYEEYRAKYVGQENPTLPIITVNNSTVKGSAIKVSESEACKTSMTNDQSLWVNFGDNAENSLYLPATGAATWEFEIPEGADALYNIRIVYFNCTTADSSISTIERKLYIDKQPGVSGIPFTEATHLSLTKYWYFDALDSVEVTDTTEADAYTVDYKTTDEGYYKIVTDIKGGKKTVSTYTIHQDINGNSMAPDVKQYSDWNTYYCQDSTGYNHGYFDFHFLNGNHTLTLEAEREPVIIKSIELVPTGSETNDIPSYADVLADYANKGYTEPKDGELVRIEAEFPDYVSDSSVYSTNDNTSAVSYPKSSKAQLYNVIGENSYNTVGQWAAYKFKVNADGLYKLSMRYKQNALQGMFVCRTIKISGGQYGLADGTPTVPFMEAYNAQFNYSKDWQSEYVCAGTDNPEEKTDPFLFYFEEGVEYTIYFECSLGSLRELIGRVEKSLEVINSCYLKILQLTGNDPDEYRNYKFKDIMPEVLWDLGEQAKELEAVKIAFEKLCGTTGSHISTLYTIAILLETMSLDDGDYIAANMATLKSYLGTLGTWINDSKRSSMMVDSIYICPSEKTDKPVRANANFFESIGFEISSFFFSFFTAYDQMGLTTIPTDDTRKIDVWLATGRDQSNIWRSMIDAKGSFTDTTGVAVALKLVTGGTLLPSILSGKGPDVYIGLGSADVINYAIRDAVIGINGKDPMLDAMGAPDNQIYKDLGLANYNEIFSSNFYTYKNADGTYTTSKEYDPSKNLTSVTESYDEFMKPDVLPDGTLQKTFADAAMNTISLRGVTYGLPETMSFSMMFYRMDVLAQLNQTVPETWSQLLALLPVLQTNNMSIGLTYGLAIDFMLYQKGGNMWKYPDDPDYAGSKIDLDSDIALEAFDYVCRLYSDYSFPVSFDAANRFRTGEMPIIIGDYAGVYNQLVVYATEIAGLWEFGSIPGYYDTETKTTNYDSIAGVAATVMLYGCDDMLGAWQFMQWQTGDTVQANYGNKMVALIGPSAKYNSANLKAINNLSWTASEKDAIQEQMRHLSSVVNYPGSYIIGRYTNFAFLAAVNDGEEPVEALKGYIDAINIEIKRKREEFNLPTGDPPYVTGQQP